MQVHTLDMMHYTLLPGGTVEVVQQWQQVEAVEAPMLKLVEQQEQLDQTTPEQTGEAQEEGAGFWVTEAQFMMEVQGLPIMELEEVWLF